MLCGFMLYLMCCNCVLPLQGCSQIPDAYRCVFTDSCIKSNDCKTMGQQNQSAGARGSCGTREKSSEGESRVVGKSRHRHRI